MLRLREIGLFKTTLPKKSNKNVKKRIEVIEETRNSQKKSTIGIYHGQHAATINVGYTDHLKKYVKWYPKKVKEKKPSLSYRFYLSETPVIAVMVIKIGKSNIPGLITQDTENIMSTLFVNRIEKYLNTECIRNGQELIQHVTME